MMSIISNHFILSIIMLKETYIKSKKLAVLKYLLLKFEGA